MGPMPPLQLGSAAWPVFPGALAAQGSAAAGVVVAPAAALGFCLPVILIRCGGGAALPGAAKGLQLCSTVVELLPVLGNVGGGFPGAATGSGAQLLLLLGSAELVAFPGFGEHTGSSLGRAFAARAGLAAPGCTPLFSPCVSRRGSSPRQLCTCAGIPLAAG